MSLDTSQLVLIGVVGRAVGVKGEFYLSKRSEPLDQKFKQIYLGDTAEKAYTYSIKNMRAHNGKSILWLDGITSREDIRELVGKSIWVERSAIKLDDSNEYIWADLVDRRLLDTQGQEIGRVVGVNNFGASDIVTIEYQDKKRIDLPFISDYFDMNFSPQDESITLVANFAELVEAFS